MASRIFPKLTASGLQATTYLLGIALFSISFLVFLNSSISFVVTDVIGQRSMSGMQLVHWDSRTNYWHWSRAHYGEC